MATSNLDVEQLIHELGASLTRFQRVAFEEAARTALAAANCTGIGQAYRLLVPLQRLHWDPPDDQRIGQPLGIGSRRPSKLASAEPIGAEDPRTGGRDRHHFKAV